MDAKKITEDIKGLESIVYQHEIDHLNGYLFTDKVEDNSTLVTYENYQKYYEEEYKKELENFNSIAAKFILKFLFYLQYLYFLKHKFDSHLKKHFYKYLMKYLIPLYKHRMQVK